jgi:superfamily II DNA or RNA helicase
MPPPILRPYQEHDLNAVRVAMRSHRSVLLVQPTGAGKGTLASYIVASASAKGKATLFLVQRRTLVHDMSRRLDKLAIDHGVIMGSDPRRKPWLHTHVASIDTLHRRTAVPRADILIVDEAHGAVSPIFRKVLDKYPAAKVLMLTATPIRLDGRGLGEVADFMVQGPSVQDLIGQRFLVPSRVLAPSAPNLSGIRTTAGDFNQKALAAACDKPRLVGDIVKHWKLHAPERKTVSFGVDQKHARDIAEQFRQAGVDCAYVDAETPDGEREKIWEDLDHGSLPIVSSVNTVSYGWDHPIVSCIIQARPTESLGLDLQQLGRGARPSPGKENFLVLDHSSNVHRHGFYEDPREWSLSGGIIKPAQEPGITISTCARCFGTFRPGPQECPFCGAPILRRERKIEVTPGELEEIRRQEKAEAIAKHAAAATTEQRRRKFLELVRVGEERGYKEGWAKIRWKLEFGSWPPRSWLASGDNPDYSDPTWEAGEAALRAAGARRTA